MAVEGTRNNPAANSASSYQKTDSARNAEQLSKLNNLFLLKQKRIETLPLSGYEERTMDILQDAFKCYINFKPPETKSDDVKDKNTDWKDMYADYKPSNTVKYNRVLNFIEKDKNLKDKSLAPKIANMVCKLSDNYGIDPEIIAKILEVETGGYKFVPEVMVNKGSHYKGVMQVDLDNIKMMYADEASANNKSLPLKARKIAYSHRFFRADDERINQLKEQYKTPDDLYKAIQEDVALGLEVGYIVFKSKLAIHKGNVDAAFKEYVGSHYTMPASAQYPKKIYPVPKYQGS